jgi:hypothetical protein
MKVVEKVKKTHFVLVTLEDCAIREILGKSMVDLDRPQMTVQYGACMVTGATDMHTQNI